MKHQYSVVFSTHQTNNLHLPTCLHPPPKKKIHYYVRQVFSLYVHGTESIYLSPNWMIFKTNIFKPGMQQYNAYTGGEFD